MRKKANLEKLLETTESHNLAGALLQATKLTKNNERRALDAKIVMAQHIDINALIGVGDIEEAEAGEDEQDQQEQGENE